MPLLVLQFIGKQKNIIHLLKVIVCWTFSWITVKTVNILYHHVCYINTSILENMIKHIHTKWQFQNLTQISSDSFCFGRNVLGNQSKILVENQKFLECQIGNKNLKAEGHKKSQVSTAFTYQLSQLIIHISHSVISSLWNVQNKTTQCLLLN